jgi:predicted kinase
MSQRVYATAAERARAAVGEGHSAIVDAVFARAGDRDAIERIAAGLSVPFAGLWLDAPERVLVARTERRRHDPSDANAEVIRMQRRQPIGVMTWHRIDASASPDVVLEHARTYLQGRVRGGLDPQPISQQTPPSRLTTPVR